jgi:hypothetical protein
MASGFLIKGSTSLLFPVSIVLVYFLEKVSGFSGSTSKTQKNGTTKNTNYTKEKKQSFIF